jgi:DNA-binding NtrC family response regulator
MSPEPDRGDVVTELQSPREEGAGTQRFRLVVVEGGDAGKELTIDGGSPSRVYVGQSPTCDLRVDDPHVSRRHAGFELAPRGLCITDLDSTNGTFVNGVEVHSALVRGGEIVRLGGLKIRVEAATASPEPLISSAESFGRVLGSSVEMRRLYSICERLSRSEVSVVIEGETGTGKEVLAESLHDASSRAKGPFVVFDCTGVAPTLVESELFGHERGAFTGATSMRRGVFEQANGGTLLIDEIGDLDPSLQPKLLRALQRGEVRRVGGDKPIPVDVRVLSATRRDLDREVQDGRFRDDLYFRLAVTRVELPPLRSRRGDISLLASHFWRELQAAGEPPYELLRRYERYNWPGNVRELSNAVARHLALGELLPESAYETSAPTGNALEDAIEATLALDLPFPRARDRVLSVFERRYLERMLTRHGGNVTKAAEASGIGRRYFTRIASRLGK